MKVLKCACSVWLVLILATLLSCGGGGSSTDPFLPEPGGKDPADVLLGVRYGISNLSASQSSTIFATVMDQNGDKIKDGTPVRFRISPDPDTTGFRFHNSDTVVDSNTVKGVASAILTHVGPLTAPRFMQVHVSVPGFIQVFRTVDVFFYSDLATSFQLTLIPEKVTLRGDGVDFTRITARIVNTAGVPFAGAEVTFAADPVFGSFQPALGGTFFTPTLSTTRITNEEGVIALNYVAGKTDKPTTVTIAASATLVFFVDSLPLGQIQVALYLADMLSLNINAQEPGSISVQVDPSRIFASVTGAPNVPGENEAQVLIRAFDVTGNPMIEGTVVSLESVNKAFPESRLGLLPAYAILGSVNVAGTGQTVEGAALVQFFAEGESGVAVIRASIGDVSGSAEIEIFDANPLQIELVASDEDQPATFQWPITECTAATRTYRVSGGLADLGQGTYVWEVTNISKLIEVDTSPANTSTATLVYDGSPIYYLDAGELSTVNMVIAVTDTATGKIRRFSVAVVVRGMDVCPPGGDAGDSDLALQATPDNARLTVGSAAQVNFEATGGVPPYTWTFNRGAVTLSDITFVSSIDQAVLVYNGAATTTPGVMIVTVTDALGHKASALVVLAKGAPGALVGSMEITPDTIQSGSEAVVRFTLEHSDGSPASGTDVVFEIVNQTPVTDTEFVAPATGTTVAAVTDANGIATAVVKAGETTATMNVLIRATADSVSVTEVLTVLVGAEISGTLQTAPATVDVGGEVVAQLTLNDSEGNPLPNQSVLLEIITQTPITDTEFLSPSTGTSIPLTTDVNGVALAVIQAGDTSDTTNIILQATVGSLTITDVFTVVRGNGKVVFNLNENPTVQIPGDQAPITVTFVMAITVQTDDGNGNPIANRVLSVEALPDFTSTSVDSTDPSILDPDVLSLLTDDDGETEFVLRVTITGVAAGAGETVAIGNLVLSGSISPRAGAPDITGTAAVIFSAVGLAP